MGSNFQKLTLTLTLYTKREGNSLADVLASSAALAFLFDSLQLGAVFSFVRSTKKKCLGRVKQRKKRFAKRFASTAKMGDCSWSATTSQCLILYIFFSQVSYFLIPFGLLVETHCVFMFQELP